MSFYGLYIYNQVNLSDSMQSGDDKLMFIKREVFFYNNLEDIMEKFRRYLSSPLGCYEVIWLGVNLELLIYENYCLKGKINLHRMVFYTFDSSQSLYFDEDDKPYLIKDDDIIVNKDNWGSEVDEYFTIKILQDEVEIMVELDFSDIMELSGVLLERSDIFFLPEFGNHRLHYGHNDLEYNNDFSEDGGSCVSISSQDEMSVGS